MNRSRSHRRLRALALLALPLGCTDVGPREEPFGLADGDSDDSGGEDEVPIVPLLSGATLQARCDAIKSTASARGIENPLIIAGVANHETHLVQCLSEWPIHCAGPHSDDCGGPVLAGSGDGPCGAYQGGLGMFQFDAGTYNQTLAMYGNGILSVSGNIDAGIDVIIHKLRVCQHTSALVGSDQQAIDFINAALPGTDGYEKYMSSMASCYNGCQPGFTSCSHEGMRAKYKAGVEDLRDQLGDDYWFSPPPPKYAVTESPRVGRSPTGRLEVFALGSDAMVHHRWQPKPNLAFADWGNLAGSFSGPPTVAANSDGRLEVFAVAIDGSLQHRYQTQPGHWGDTWESLGGSDLALTGEPFVARNADGRLEVFARDEDGQVWNKWQTAASSPFVDEWNLFGEDLASRVVVAANADGRLEAFARSDAGSVVHRWQEHPSSGWSDWHDLGGNPAAAPAVGINADGRLEVFMVGEDGRLHHRWQEQAGGWAKDWASRDGASFVGTPIVASNLDGRMELVVRDEDGTLWHTWQQDLDIAFADGWDALGDDAIGDPQFGRNEDGRIEIFALHGDGRLWHVWQVAPNGTWSAWEPFGDDIEAF